LADEDSARKLADYLLTLKIETRLEQQSDGWILWVCDEDHVAEARQVFGDFIHNQKDDRFASAGRVARELRLRELQDDEDYRQRLTDFRKQMSERSPPQPRYFTAILVVSAVIISVTTNFGKVNEGYMQLLPLSTEQGPYLSQIARGEIWRL